MDVPQIAFSLTVLSLQFGCLMRQQDAQTLTLCQKVRLIAWLDPKIPA